MHRRTLRRLDTKQGAGQWKAESVWEWAMPQQVDCFKNSSILINRIINNCILSFVTLFYTVGLKTTKQALKIYRSGEHCTPALKTVLRLHQPKNRKLNMMETPNTQSIGKSIFSKRQKFWKCEQYQLFLHDFYLMKYSCTYSNHSPLDLCRTFQAILTISNGVPHFFVLWAILW